MVMRQGLRDSFTYAIANRVRYAMRSETVHKRQSNRTEAGNIETRPIVLSLPSEGPMIWHLPTRLWTGRTKHNLQTRTQALDLICSVPKTIFSTASINYTSLRDFSISSFLPAWDGRVPRYSLYWSSPTHTPDDGNPHKFSTHLNYRSLLRSDEYSLASAACVQTLGLLTHALVPGAI